MKNMDQMNITDYAVLKPAFVPFGEEYGKTCRKLFKFAAMMTAGHTLGMQFSFGGEKIPEAAAFSDAGLSEEDYVWMFGACTDTVTVITDGGFPFDGTNTYFLTWNEADETEEAYGFCHLAKDLRGITAVLRILIPTGSGSAQVLIRTEEKLPLRIRAMLSIAFHNAEVCEYGQETDSVSKGIPSDIISEKIEGLLSEITEIRDIEDCAEKEGETSGTDKGDEVSIEDLDLSTRAYNVLKRAGFSTLADLRTAEKADILNLRNMNERCYLEIIRKMKEYRPEEVRADAETSGLELLNRLIGLADVKAQVRKITALSKMQQDMDSRGRDFEPVTLNMVFAGNPGTAKTTVARIMAKILCETGYLKSPEVLEVGRADLVAGYVGQTAGKVKHLFEKARGRLLFIDEAYALIDEEAHSFGDEAISTIVAEMENCRKDTVVVFAGYPGPMEQFLSRNPGLRSRIPFHICFSNYSAEEMTGIALSEANRRGFSVSAEAVKKMTAVCAEAGKNTESGNGRFCRNLIENAVLSYAERMYGEAAGEAAANDFVLREEDFSFTSQAERKENRTIGFRV